GLLRDAVEEQVPEVRVRREAQAGVARDEGGLPGQRARRMLQAERGEMSDFALILVEIVAEVVAPAVDREARADLRSAHAVQVGDLEAVIGAPQDARKAIAVVEDLLEIAEEMMLARVVMHGIGAAVGGLD